MDPQTRVDAESLAALQAAAFKHNLPAQLELHEIRRIVARADGLTCLDVSGHSPLFSFHLRKAGGDWQTAVSDAYRVDAARGLLDDRVCALHGGRLPFDDKIFDLVVLTGLLEAFEDDVALVRECHRVLKTDGRLVVGARSAKRWSLVSPLRALVGLSAGRSGQWAARHLGRGRIVARGVHFRGGSVYLGDFGDSYFERCIFDAGERPVLQAQREGRPILRECLARSSAMGFVNVSGGCLAAVVLDVPRDPFGPRPDGLAVDPRWFVLTGPAQSVPQALRLARSPLE